MRWVQSATTRISPGLVAFLVYALITAILLGAVWRHPSTTNYPDVSRDNYSNFWNLWWFQESVRAGSNPFRTHLLYFPTGTSLQLTEFGPLYGLLSMPAFVAETSWHTAVRAHNFWVFLTFPLTAFAGFLYARAIGGSNRGALLAGFLLGFCAFRFHQIEDLNLLSFYWMPLCALVTHRFAGKQEGGGTRNWWLIALLLCGFGAAATSLTVLTLTTFLLVTWTLLVGVLDRSRYSWPHAALAVLAFVLGSLPVTGGIVLGFLSGAMGDASASTTGVVRFSPDLLGFFSPEQSWIFGPMWRSVGPQLHGAGGRNMYLGFALLILAFLGLRRAGRSGAVLGATALVGLLASLGPGIWIANRHFALPISVYQLLQHVPPFSLNRVPERLVLVTLTTLTPLAAMGFESLAGDRKRWVWGAVLIVLAAMELTPSPIRAVPVVMPEAYARLRDDPHPGAVLELTLVGRTANEFAFHQIAHRRPIMMGPVNRPSGDAVEFLDQGRYEERLRDPVAFPSALRDLERAGVAFVIWHREGWEGPAWEILRTEYAKHAAVWFQDNDLIVFRLAES